MLLVKQKYEMVNVNNIQNVLNIFMLVHYLLLSHTNDTILENLWENIISFSIY